MLLGPTVAVTRIIDLKDGGSGTELMRFASAELLTIGSLNGPDGNKISCRCRVQADLHLCVQWKQACVSARHAVRSRSALQERVPGKIADGAPRELFPARDSLSSEAWANLCSPRSSCPCMRAGDPEDMHIAFAPPLDCSISPPEHKGLIC